MARENAALETIVKKEHRAYNKLKGRALNLLEENRTLKRKQIEMDVQREKGQMKEVKSVHLASTVDQKKQEKLL